MLGVNFAHKVVTNIAEPAEFERDRRGFLG